MVSEGENRGMKLLYLNVTTACNNRKCVMFCDISKVKTWERYDADQELDVLWTQEMVGHRHKAKDRSEKLEGNEE